jgi:hypothetical protein
LGELVISSGSLIFIEKAGHILSKEEGDLPEFQSSLNLEGPLNNQVRQLEFPSLIYLLSLYLMLKEATTFTERV